MIIFNSTQWNFVKIVIVKLSDMPIANPVHYLMLCIAMPLKLWQAFFLNFEIFKKNILEKEKAVVCIIQIYKPKIGLIESEIVCRL